MAANSTTAILLLLTCTGPASVADEPMEVALDLHEGGVRAVSFSRDGKRFAAYGGSRVVKEWSLAKGTLVSERPLSEMKPAERAEYFPAAPVIHYHRDFELSSVAQDGSAAILLNVVGLTPRGKYGKIVRVIDVKSEETRQEITGKEDVARSALTSDAKTAVLASAVTDGLLMIMDVATGKEKARVTLPVPTPVFTSLVFSPNSRWLVAGATTKLYVIDIKGASIATKHTFRNGVSALRCTPDSRRVAVGTWDGKLRFIPLPED